MIQVVLIMLVTDLAQYRLHLVDILVTRSLSLMPMVLLGFSSEAINIYLPILALQSVFIHRGEHCLLWFTLDESANRSIEVTDKEIDSSPNKTAHEHCGIFTIPGSDQIQGAWRDISYVPVRDNIWTVSEGIYRTIFIEGKKGIIAFDTFTTPGGARAFQGAMHRVFPHKPVHTIVYSHDHLDHTGYAADLAPEADIIAHDLCNQVITGRQSDGQLEATETWSGERKQYRIDGVEFELIYPGPTHGDGNVAAYFPQSKLLFMVDTVIPGVGYTFFPDWHLSPYVPTMRRFLSLDWDTFVPGHFWITDRSGFEENLDYYDRMAEMAQEAIGAGLDADDYAEVTSYTYQHLKPKFGRHFRFDEYCAMNLSRYMQHYLTGGWGIEGNMTAEIRPL